MIRLILGALRARRAQTVTVLLLALLAAAAATAAPWYVLAADDAALVTDVTAAPPSVRLFSAAHGEQPGNNPSGTLEDFRGSVTAALDIPGATGYAGMYQGISYVRESTAYQLAVAYREGVCDHVTVTGRCPRQAGEAMLSTWAAGTLRVGVGDTLTLRNDASGPPVPVAVVGLYTLTDPTGDYWADSVFGGLSGATTGFGTQLAPAFVPLGAFADSRIASPTAVYDVVPPVAAFRHPGDLRRRLDHAQYVLGGQNMQIVSGSGVVLDQIGKDRRLIHTGVLVGAGQLLVLSWFALFLAGRFTGQERRRDIALLKLRGAGASRILRLVTGQNAVPLLGGAVLGAGVGYLVARLAVDRAGGSGWAGPDPGLAWALAGGGVALAVLGALVAILAAEWRTLRTPVADLLRGVPPRRRGWRTDVLDLAVVALAVAGAYQVRAEGPAGSAEPGLALLAPGLVALAVALLLARALGYLTERLGDRALRAGRVPLALGALQVARRPGTDRVFALLAVAVAVLGTAASGWAVGGRARAERSAVDVGASRVLTVQAGSRTQLLAAVQAADPSGRYAMAAVVSGAGATPVLAVDTGRLAAVADWVPGYGTSAATLARLLRPAAPEPLTVNGSSLVLEATLVTPGPRDTYLLATLERLDTGEAERVAFGPLKPGRNTYTGPVAACHTAAGCRLTSFQLAGPPGVQGDYPAAAEGVQVGIHDLSQLGPDRPVVPADVLRDVRRWRAPAGLPGPVVSFATSGDQLLVAAQSPAGVSVTQLLAQRVFVVDGPVPLPVAVAGASTEWRTGDATLSPFGADLTPIRVVATLPAVPVLGASGVLVDLVAADRAVSAAAPNDRDQVWLAPGAGSAVVDRLRQAGLTVLSDDSVAARDRRLGRQGPAAALRFALLAAVVGVVLAAATVGVAGAVERGPRGTELAALRAQGLPVRAAARVAYGGYAALVAAGVLAGLLATALARVVADVGLPAFSDGWFALPVPAGPDGVAVLLAGLAAAVLLGAVAVADGRQLHRAARGDS